MKKCFLIVDYSDTEEKKNMLINLINDIKSHNYEIFLSSHINHDKKITNLVDYFYYDKENTLNYDYKYKIKKIFNSDSFKIEYKPLKKFSTHGFAIMRITLQPMILLKSLNYDIIHRIEYDNLFKSWDFIRDFENKLDKYDIVGVKRFYEDYNRDKDLYTLSGEFWSIKLSNFNYNDFEYDYSEWKKMFDYSINKYNSVIFEYVVHEKFVSKHNYFAYEEGFLNSVFNLNLISSVGNINNIENSICFFEDDNQLKIFIDNLNGDKDEKIKLIFDKIEEININVKKGLWNLNTIKYNFNDVDVEISDKFCVSLKRNSPFIEETKFNLF